jgi:hypothetical protein
MKQFIIKHRFWATSIGALFLLGIVLVLLFNMIFDLQDERAIAAKTGNTLDTPRELRDDDLKSVHDGVVILCYHYFRPTFDPEYMTRALGAVVLNLPTLGYKEFWTTPVTEFERHLRFFRDEGIPVLTLDELSGDDVPIPAVVLTIDDADRSVYDLIFPLLKKYDMRAHLNVPTAKVGQHWSGLDVCSWDQLNEMAASGYMLLESHGHDMHWKVASDKGFEPSFMHPESMSMSTAQELSALLPDEDSPSLAAERVITALSGAHAAVAKDLWTSRQLLAQHTGRAPEYLAWPYGYATVALDSAAAELGFQGTLSLAAGAWRPGDEPWHMRRYAVTAKTTLELISELFEED